MMMEKDDSTPLSTLICPSLTLSDQGEIVPHFVLPAGVKFDPTDHQILEHLEAKIMAGENDLLIDAFIPTLEEENSICYTHPENLPGVSKDGQIRHFFHRPSKAYSTGTRKRRRVPENVDGIETRWHQSGKPRQILADGDVKGFKKILVLYTNYGRQRKPEKTNWVIHQYHLSEKREERHGELVVSKVLYQMHPRQSRWMTVRKPKYTTPRSVQGVVPNASQTIQVDDRPKTEGHNAEECSKLESECSRTQELY